MPGQRGAAASGLLRNKTGSRQEEKPDPTLDTLQSAARKQLRAAMRDSVTMLWTEVMTEKHKDGERSEVWS